MGSKIKQSKAISSNKSFKAIAEKIQAQFEDGSLKLSIEVEGKEVGIIEELCASMLVLDGNTQYKTLIRFLKEVNFNTLDTMLDDKFSKEFGNYTIANSVNCVDKTYIRHAVYRALLSKNSACGEVIAIIIYGIMETFNGRTNISLDYGVDSCIISTILYWAYKNGITDEFFKYISPSYFKKVKQWEYIEESYKDTLTKTNEKFGEMYYDFKTEKIDKQEYLTLLVSENGNLPLPRGDDLTTSPEFSWQVVENIVGENLLQTLDYSDEVKEAISHIFQRFYDSIHFFSGEVYNYLIQGLFYSLNKTSIKQSFKQLETDKNIIAKYDTKLQDLKSHVKKLKKDVERQKNESTSLRKTGEDAKRKLNKLTVQGLTDIEPYIGQIKQRDSEIETLKKRIEELERRSSKKDTSIKELEKSNRGLKESVDSTFSLNEELKEKVGGLINNNSDDSIPIECIVNSIRDHRIVVFGGDKIHALLKNMGFKNLKLVKANDKTISKNEIKYADAMVIATGLLSHATSSTPKNTAESFGTPIMYFNSHSANKLCRELFTFLNSEEYKKKVCC